MLGKMVVLGAIFSCLDPILSIACVLAEKDIFVIAGQKKGALTISRKYFALNCKSDHIMLARVVKQWEAKYEEGWSRSFCKKFCLNERVLEAVYSMKKQLHEALEHRGLVVKNGGNFNSENEELVRAVVAAGLYPNVAKSGMRMGRSGSFFPVLSTAKQREVNIHKRYAKYYGSPCFFYYYFFHTIFQTILYLPTIGSR